MVSAVVSEAERPRIMPRAGFPVLEPDHGERCREGSAVFALTSTGTMASASVPGTRFWLVDDLN